MATVSKKYSISASMVTDTGNLFDFQTIISDPSVQFQKVDQFVDILSGSDSPFTVPISAGDILIVECTEPVTVNIDGVFMFNVTFLILDKPFTQIIITMVSAVVSNRIRVMSLSM